MHFLTVIFISTIGTTKTTFPLTEMGAAGSISDDAMKENIKISQFCDDKLKSIRYIPRMDECFDATFPGPEGDASRVPQKYIWLQGVCAAFVIFTDMKGKTLPELWDDYAGTVQYGLRV